MLSSHPASPSASHGKKKKKKKKRVPSKALLEKAAGQQQHYQHFQQQALLFIKDERLHQCLFRTMVVIFALIAIHIAALPFQEGAFQPNNPNSIAGNNITTMAGERDISFGSDHLEQLLLDLRRHNKNGGTRRVVLLPGPHATGTSSIQKSLLLWTNHSAHQHVFQSWSYPIPTREELKEIHYTVPHATKAFGPLFCSLKGSLQFYDSQSDGNNKKDSDSSKIQRRVQELYRKKFREAWYQQNKSLVVASEHLDSILDKGGVDSSTYLNNFFSLLPTPSTATPESIWVVVTYRSPRSMHLTSLWHKHGQKDQSFSQFLMSDKFALIIHQLDPLGLADKFARYSESSHNKNKFQVILLDTSGLDGTDLTVAVACHILRVPCQNNIINNSKHDEIIGLEQHEPKELHRIPNPGKMDLLETQLESLDTLLKEFDCQYQNDWMATTKSHDRHILFRNQLFRDCPKAKRQSLHDLAKRIAQLAKQANSKAM